MLFFVVLAFSVNANTSSEASKVKLLKSYIKTTDSEDFLRLASSLSNLSQQYVGQNCGATNIFNTTGVFVDPYPIAAETLSNVIQYGYFYQDTFVEENVIGICLNSMAWNYFPCAVNKHYKTGVLYSITTVLNLPNIPGTYTINMQLVSSGIHISCWEFSFNL